MSSHDHPLLLLQATAGEPLAIVLDAQPGAGLLWKAPPPPVGCRLVADGQTPTGAGDGGGVQQRFQFTAPAAGEHQLLFSLQRGWTNRVHAVQPVQIQVR